MATLMELPTLSLLIIASLVTVYALWWLQSVLVPLTLAVGFAQLFQPFVCWLCLLRGRRKRQNRPATAEMDDPLAASLAESHGISLEGTDSRGNFLDAQSPTSSQQLGEGAEVIFRYHDMQETVR
eukprot:s1036_g7.t1